VNTTLPIRPIVLTAVAVVVLALAFEWRFQHEMADFEVYWRAGARAIAGAPLYRSDDGHYQLKYLPAFALAMAPLGLLPLTTAKAVWFAALVVCIGMLVRLSVALWPGTADRRLLASAVIVLMAKFYLHELTLGQTNALMAVLVLLALKWVWLGRDGQAGLALAGAVLVKPYALAFLPYLVVRRRWTACAWMAVGLSLLLLLPAVRYGIVANGQLLLDWVRTVRESSAPNLLNQDNVSVWAMYAKWLEADRAAVLWLGLGTVGGMALVLAWIAGNGQGIRGREYLEIAAILLALALGSPQGWDYVLLISTPVVVIMVATRSAMPAWLRATAFGFLLVQGLSLHDVMGRRAYAAFMAMSWISICGLVLFATLAILRARRVA
jgi:hypothetical protein